MLDILAITGPIYIDIFIGFLTTRLGLFAKADWYGQGLCRRRCNLSNT